MAKINLLSPQVYNVISAGEVIETPAGALKELVENSIDAGARRIAIEVANGGFDLISVADNGCGIHEEDVERAFWKHATSKLQTADDLFAVETLGFRGEALSSIASVARVKLTARANGEQSAVCVNLEDGVVTNKTYASANVGTRIEVRDLFYNTPARKKFFKAPNREAVDVTKFVAKLILTNPNLQISYVLDGQTVYQTNGNGLEEAIFAIYGGDCLGNCLPINADRDNMRLTGYIGTPAYSKPNRTYQTISVNGRCISDVGITSSIGQAFKPYLMTRQYPFVVLNLELPSTYVDVNVHPKKSEVRFANQQAVNSFFYRSVQTALEGYAQQMADEFLSQPQTFEPLPQPITLQESLFDALSQTDGSHRQKLQQVVQSNRDVLEVMNPGQAEDVIEIERITQKLDNERQFEAFADQLERELTVQNVRKMVGLDGDGVHQDSAQEQEQTSILRNAEMWEAMVNPPRDDLFDRARILGAAFKTYLILEIDDKIILVDQHAAHERILFDKFIAGASQDMQPVMFPYVFTVSDGEAQFIEDNRQNILQAGFEVEPFGKNTFRISSVSTLLADTDMKEFVEFLLASVEEFKVDERALIVEKIAKKACKAAIKAGNTLNEHEIKQILHDVYDNKILQCPHGRPITVVYTKKQLEKMFKRIV